MYLLYIHDCIKMVITPLVINIFMKLAPLDSAHLIHAKNSIFFLNSQMVPILIAGHNYFYVMLTY